MPNTSTMGPSSAHFNFAQYLLDCNAQRPDKLAFVDDLGSLSYGALADRIRAVAGALVACGVHREERVLLLMHDCNDWPSTFLGAMYAGIVPVAVNTLLTVDDYAYMLQKSRSQVALVSQALLPVLQQAMAQAQASGGHEVRQIVVSAPQGPLPAGVLALDDFLAAHAPQPACAATGADDPGFWLFSSGSTGRPKATVHSQINPYWTATLYGQKVLELTAQDVCFSAAKLFFAYGLGNGLSFPLSVGATTSLTATLAGGGLIGLALASRVLGRGADPFRMASYGALTGVPAFALVIAAAPFNAPEFFAVGTLLVGFGAGLFGHGTLTSTMNLAPRNQVGLALGAWGAAQAVAAGLAIALGGIIRDVVASSPSQSLFGPATGYICVYALEIILLVWTLVTMAPLMRGSLGISARSSDALT